HQIHKNWHIPAEVLIQPYHLLGDEKAERRRVRAAAG
ncbi:MAG: XRE family transcriptional regulator, partial [Mesorhizobium sp.]